MQKHYGTGFTATKLGSEGGSVKANFPTRRFQLITFRLDLRIQRPHLVAGLWRFALEHARGHGAAYDG